MGVLIYLPMYNYFTNMLIFWVISKYVDSMVYGTKYPKYFFQWHKTFYSATYVSYECLKVKIMIRNQIQNEIE